MLEVVVYCQQVSMEALEEKILEAHRLADEIVSAVTSNNNNNVEQSINSYENSFVQKPSTHRIYLTPEEVPHNKSKLSLQMC